MSGEHGPRVGLSSREALLSRGSWRAFDPAVLVDGEGRRLPLSADAPGIDDDDDAREQRQKFVAAWRRPLPLRGRQTLCGDELLEEALDVELRKGGAPRLTTSATAAPQASPEAYQRPAVMSGIKSLPWCEKPLPSEAPDGSFCDWACASEHTARKPNNSQASGRSGFRTRRRGGLWFGRARVVSPRQH